MSEIADDIAAFSRQANLSVDDERALSDIVDRLRATSIGATPSMLASAAEPPLAVLRQGSPDRYEDLGLIGKGGMGEVRRVRDRDLGRTLAMKVVRPEVQRRASVLDRFIEEAQATAQLQHPGIVPVHELGRLADGSLYFTMQEVEGRTLGDVIVEVHRASSAGWEAGPTGWTFRRLVDAFERVCEAVAYAHARGVVHRDLKPENMMVGTHGEVRVVDWGLAKVTGRPDVGPRALEPVVTDRSRDTNKATHIGAVNGTPAYMPPEQAQGDVDRIDARADVYALGAILYEILSGQPPYQGENAGAVLAAVLAGPPRPLHEQTGRPIPTDLRAIVERAMARNPSARFAHAGEVGHEVAAWLDGARRRERALEVVAQAVALRPEAEALMARALKLREEAARLLDAVRPWEPEALKAPAWAKEDEAAALERRIEALDLEAGQRLNGALQIDPATPEAHAALAERYGAAHAAAERVRDVRAVAQADARLRLHAVRSVPDVSRRWDAYLQGDGAITLVTDPPGAAVALYRYQLWNRRLIPVFERSLGKTPLLAVPLAMGSYLLLIRHPERAEVRYPVSIGRGEHWDGVAPGEREPAPVRLPYPKELGPADCYVPQGWFWSGGDPEVVSSLPRHRIWCEGLVMRRFPVTNRENIGFLNDLVAQGREDEALAAAPRERGGTVGEQGALIYAFEGGCFSLRPDADGDMWLPDWPVTMVEWQGAAAHAAWEAERTGAGWRLPGELEWEKAARGVDGRFCPWGDVVDASWCCGRDSCAGRPGQTVVDSFPVDESPFGVRGCGGNVRDWCADAYAREGPQVVAGRVGMPEGATVDPATVAARVSRGGSWGGAARNARVTYRFYYVPPARNIALGFRLARSFGA